MNARTDAPFVDTNIIPDRNAGVGSLLWDLQNPRDPGDRPLLDREFAFIDVGVSRPNVAIALKTLLTRDLGMAVDYVATERLQAVPYANVTPVGESEAKIRACLCRLISTQAAHDVKDWHFVVDCIGRVSSIAYSYDLHGNEVWESYFMGRAFMYGGEKVEFSDPELAQMLAPHVLNIEARVDLGRRGDGNAIHSSPIRNGYRVEASPLETGLAESGIAFQTTDVPQRIAGKQNVLFVGNVLNHYPHDEHRHELDKIAATLEERDLVIVQVDEVGMSSIEVLLAKGRGARETRERVMWIDTETLEVQRFVDGPGSPRQIHMKPAVDRAVNRFIERLEMNVSSAGWTRETHKALVHRTVGHVFRTFFRALPVEETLRPAIREALRRLASDDALKGIPVFKGDARDAYGGLASDQAPIVSERDLAYFGANNMVRTAGYCTTSSI